MREIVHDTAVGLGAQNAHWEAQGACTGEVAASMLRDAGCTHVILGHSERRQHFDETDATVRKKVRAALDAGLDVIVCVGETLAEREAGDDRRASSRAQLRERLDGLTAGDWPAGHPRLRAGVGDRHRPQRQPRAGPGGARSAARLGLGDRRARHRRSAAHPVRRQRQTGQRRAFLASRTSTARSSAAPPCPLSLSFVSSRKGASSSPPCTRSSRSFTSSSASS